MKDKFDSSGFRTGK